MQSASASAPRTARDLVDRGREFLRRKGIEEWRLEAELLVAHGLGLGRLELFLELDRPVQTVEIDRSRQLLVRRVRGEPTAYLTGEREFYGRTFRVGPGVLIPRPETELLVDRAREWAAERPEGGGPASILDMGTGCGCLAVTLALELPSAEVTAVDVSRAALEFARANIRALGASVRCLQGDGFTPFARGPAPFDLIVANPPYVRGDEHAALPTEVRDQEPSSALLVPAAEPDLWVDRLSREGLGLLRAGGAALVELGWDQAERLGPQLSSRGVAHRFHRDLAGIERVLELGPIQGGPVERGPVERGPVERGPVERGPVERGPHVRGR